MKTFFEESLNRVESQTLLESVRKKYHYQEEQLEELAQVAKELLPRMRQEARWEHKIFYGELLGGKSWHNLPMLPITTI